MSPRPRPSEPRFTSFWDLTAFAIVLLACKVHRLILVRGAAEGVGWTTAMTALQSIAADWVFVLAWGIVSYAVLSRPVLARVARLPMRIATTSLIAVALADHAFLLTTGATLDWHIVRYGFAHFGELRPIFVSVGGRKLVVASAFLLGIALLPRSLESSPLGKRAASGIASVRISIVGGRGRLLFSLLGVAVLAPSCILVSTSPAESASFLAENVYFRLGRLALGDLAGGRRKGPVAHADRGERLVETRQDRHYNVVLVILESARAKSFSLYGKGATTAPFFEKLARRGALVESAYTVTPHTTKAIVSIQCGIYPRLDPEPFEAIPGGIPVRCLPDLFRDFGYRSAFFQPAEENFERRKDLVRELGYDTFIGKQSLESAGFDESNYLGFEDGVLLRPVLDWVDAQTTPFLLTVLTLASHHPYSIPAGFDARSFVEDPSENDYLNTLAYTDGFLNDLLGELEARQLLDRTIVAVLGDHGEAFGEHGVRQHDAVPYEEALRVPMLWLGQPFKAGSRIGGLRQSIDVLPTLVEAAGFRLEPSSLPGRSMLSPLGHDRLYFSCHYRDYCLATRGAKEKLVYHYGRRAPELFDLLGDPDERQDLAPRRPLDTSALVHDLKRWKAHVDAQFTEGRPWQAARDVSTTPPETAHPVAAEIGPDIRLLGFDIDRERLPIGELLTISHHFFVERKPDPSLTFVFHLMGPRSEDLTHPLLAGAHPLSQWKAGDYVTDRFTYFARPGTPQGSYELMVGLWQNRSSSIGHAEIRPLTDGAAVDRDGRIATARFEVVAPPFAREDYVHAGLPPEWDPTEVMLTPEIGSFGCKLSKERVKRGLKTTLSCLYHALRDYPHGRLCVSLDGPVSKSIGHVPVRGTYPLGEWRADEYIRDELDIYLTSADPNGDYGVLIGVEVDGPSDRGAPCARENARLEAGHLTLSE